MKLHVFLLFPCLLLAHSLPCDYDDTLELSIVHLNDFHARFQEVSQTASICKDESTCIGGFARLYTVIKEAKNQKNFILLNIGDNFQGSPYYNIFKWNITQHFLNMLPFDAYTLGNHDFDDGVAGAVPFIEKLWPTPTVVSNIDDSLEPLLQDTYFKSTIIVRDGKKIGLIGVITNTTSQISASGKLKFLEESASVNQEALRLVEEEDVYTNIVLSHCGYIADQHIALNLPLESRVSVIVGGHSHSLLYTGTSTPNNETAEGPYPTVVTQSDGNKVLIVQASAFTKYLGNLTVFYDEHGKVASWEGNPIYLAHEIPQDPMILQELKPWQEYVTLYGSKILAVSLVDLTVSDCYTGECNLGSFMADAYLEVWKNFEEKEQGAWAYVSICFQNAGGFRAPILEGNVTYNDALTTQPFGNTIDVGEVEGRYLKEALEYSVEKTYEEIFIPQVSGMNVVYNLKNPVGSRVESLKIRCQNCPTPVYEDYLPDKIYRIVVHSFLRNGGNGFVALSDNLKNVKIGPVDIDFLNEYLPQVSPINQGLDGRIQVIGAPLRKNFNRL